MFGNVREEGKENVSFILDVTYPVHSAQAYIDF